jgi:TRAP-type C4-dicarboxylate transport system permease small subunit
VSSASTSCLVIPGGASPKEKRSAVSKLHQFISDGYRKALRLFHMLVGLAFLGFAIVGATLSVKEWERYQESASFGLATLYLYGGFTVLLILCGLYSFVKARSVR